MPPSAASTLGDDRLRGARTRAWPATPPMRCATTTGAATVRRCSALVRHHGVKAAHFLHHTHIAAGARSGACTATATTSPRSRRLPGRKFILTNAPRAYAMRVLGALRHRAAVRWRAGDRGHEHVRPAAAQARRAHAAPRRGHACGVPASRCVLVEDTLVHQKAARGRRHGARSGCSAGHAAQRETPQHGGKVGVYLHRKPAYVCARITSLQQLPRTACRDVRPAR